ncbi:MAG: PaaI family thioesterase [Candidatus Zixiibacteriota bacterium]
MKEIAKYKGCFVCGDENHIGLNAKFFFDGQKAVSEITADEKYAGYKNIFHGGIISTMLDEIMIKALLAEDLFVVTAEMTVRYKRPVFTGDVITFQGYKTGIKGPVYLTEGKAINQNGEIVAEATGKYLAPKTDLAGKLRDSVEP